MAQEPHLSASAGRRLGAVTHGAGQVLGDGLQQFHLLELIRGQAPLTRFRHPAEFPFQAYHVGRFYSEQNPTGGSGRPARQSRLRGIHVALIDHSPAGLSASFTTRSRPPGR